MHRRIGLVSLVLLAACRQSARQAPITPALVLDSPALTASPEAVVHLKACGGLADILVAGGLDRPDSTDQRWVSCTTAPLAVALTEGSNSIAVWGKAASGLMSASPAVVMVTLDTLPPAVSASGVSAGETLGADGELRIQLTTTDPSGIALAALEISSDGASWAQAASIAHVQSGAYTLALQLPASAGPLQLRVRAVDTLGNQGFTQLGTIQLVECDAGGAPFGGGTGLAGHPLRICTAAHLAAVPRAPDADFLLEADLDLTGAPLQLGPKVNGTFDGHGHTISNFGFHLDPLPAGAQGLAVGAGLFSMLAIDGEGRTGTAAVLDLSLAVAGIDAPDRRAVGGLVGYLGGGGTIDHCSLTVAGHVAGSLDVGAIAGYVEPSASVSNSSVAGGGAVSCIPSAISQGSNIGAGRVGGAIGRVHGVASDLAVGGVSVTCTDGAGTGVGGVIGELRPEGSASGLSAQGVSVTGTNAIGGAVGHAAGTVAHASVSGGTIVCAGPAGSFAEAGGALGDVDGAAVSFTGVQGAQVQCAGFNGVGGIAGLVENGASLDDSTATGVQVWAAGGAGGAVGRLQQSAIARVYAEGRSKVTSVGVSGAIGGLVGWSDGGSYTQVGADTVLSIQGSGGASVELGGLIGGISSAPGNSVSISQAYGRAIFHLTGAINGQVGGLIGGLGPDNDSSGNPVPGGTVSIADAYVDDELPSGIPGGGLIGGHDAAVSVSVARAFSYGSGGPQGCLLGGSPSGVAFASVFFNSDRCANDSSAPAAALGSPLTQAQMAAQPSFPGFLFGSAWAMGAAHPVFGFEPVDPRDAPPAVSWTPPPTLVAGTSTQVSLDVTDARAGVTAIVEVSLDGGRTWIAVGVAGPLGEGIALVELSIPDDDFGQALVRLRLIDGDGTTLVPIPAPLVIEPSSTCNPAAAPFGGGAGTADHPYLICSVPQLGAVAGRLEGDFRLDADLDVSSLTAGLGYLRQGTFDGNGHTLSGFSTSVAPLPPGSTALGKNVGLFAALALDAQGNPGAATVENLTLTVGTIDAPDRVQVGGLVGDAGAGAAIDNCRVIANGHISGVAGVGAIAGSLEVGSALTNSSAAGPGTVEGLASPDTSTASNSNDCFGIGGAAGYVGGSASGVSASGMTVSCADPNGFGLGGVIGFVDTQGSATGVTAQNDSALSAMNGIGGAVGANFGTVSQVAVTSTTVSAGALVGGAIGYTQQGSVTSQVAVSATTVSGEAFVGGATGMSRGAADHLSVAGGRVSGPPQPDPASGPCFGGVIGLLQQASASQVTVTGSVLDVPANEPVGGVVGCLDGSLASATASGLTITSGGGPVGGVVGVMNSSSTLAGAFSVGRSHIQMPQLTIDDGHVGGVIGFANDGDQISQVGSDAIISITGSTSHFVQSGGIAGNVCSGNSLPAAISQAWSHVIFEFTYPDPADNMMASGLVGGVCPDGNPDGSIAPGGAVSISDSYADVELEAINASAGVYGGIDTRVATNAQRVFTYGSGLADSCVAGLYPNGNIAPVFTGVFYNTDRCHRSANSGDANHGSGLGQLQMADESQFAVAGYDFGPQGPWTMGAAHPVLKIEPADPDDVAPTAVWPSPPSALVPGSPGALSLTLGPAGAAQALVQVSLDGGLTWITIGAAGPLGPGAQQLGYVAPDGSGSAEVRIVLTSTAGATTVLVPVTVQFAGCDPAGAPFGGGNGTSGAPWRICSLAQLAQVQNFSNQGQSANFSLESDFDLTGVALTLGQLGAGSFEGNGHQLTGFTLPAPSGTAPFYDLGLFGDVGSLPGNGSPLATVQDLTLEVVSLDAAQGFNVGGLVGHLWGGGTVRNCTVLLAGQVASAGFVGGLVGTTEAGSAVLDSQVSLSPGATAGGVSCDPAGPPQDQSLHAIGGAVGGGDGSISGVSVTGISVGCANGSQVGGIVGSASGPVESSSAVSVTVSGQGQVGGAVGFLFGHYGGTIDSVQVSSSTVSCSQGPAGGGIGYLQPASTGSNLLVQDTTVSCPTGSSVGGLVGQTDSGWGASFALQRSQAVRTNVAGVQCVGGAVGSLNGGTSLMDVIVSGRPALTLVQGGGLAGCANDSFTLLRCGTDASITTNLYPPDPPSSAAGGLFGRFFQSGTATITQCYSRARIGGASDSAGGLVGDLNLIAGNGSALITDSYFEGSLPQPAGSGQFSGGLLGTLQVPSSSNVSIQRVFAVAAAPNGSCLFGSLYVQDGTRTGLLANGDWNSDVCTSDGTGLGSGLTSAQMTNESAFAGFAFIDSLGGGPWTMGSTHPVLWWEP